MSFSEDRINERRNWKAETFPYDYFIPDETQECQYCLTYKQAEILRGIIQPLGWLTRWWSETDATVDRDTIEAFRDDITRRLMMSCCTDDLIFTYDDDGNLQVSDDGGVTFTPAPQDDIRINPKVKFPPMSGDDGSEKKCIAATGATDLLKSEIGDQLTDDMSRYTLAQLITDWTTTLIGTSNPFQALVTIIANQIFALVIATLRPALTDTVYAILKCILYCRMSDSAFFSEAAWQNVRSDITAQIGGIAGVFLEHIVYLLGNGGLSNLARAGGAATGDCSDCAECPSNCDPSGWAVGLWLSDVLYIGAPACGAFVSSGDDYVIADSTDRGDGQQVITLSVRDRATCCTIRPEFIGGEPPSVLHSYNNCPDRADYATQVADETGSSCRSGTAWYFQMSSGGPWRVKFNFVEDCL